MGQATPRLPHFLFGASHFKETDFIERSSLLRFCVCSGGTVGKGASYDGSRVKLPALL